MLFTPIKPMLLSMGSEVINSEGKIWEPKYDGWRILIHKQGDRIEAYTKQGNLITYKFPELEEVKHAINAKSAIIDCEGVCFRDKRPVFDDFQYRGRLTDKIKIMNAQSKYKPTFVAFDVLYSDADHTNKNLMVRKEILSGLIGSNEYIVPTMFVEDQGVTLHQKMKELNWEGTICKNKFSKYKLNGVRSTEWVKHKLFKTIATVILGYRTQPTFALLVGLNFKTVENKPVALVEFGMSSEEKHAFINIAKSIHTTNERDIQRIEPVLCCNIQYLEKTERHNLRITSFKGFLMNKNPKECVWIS